MKLASSARPTTPQEGVAFIEQFIFPTLEICERLEDEKKILAGGPVGGAIALAFVIKAESIQELDELVESLPIWPRMETTVTPLTSFDGRKAALRSRLERLRTTLQTA
jgi:muconolactone delta-isomerase